MGTATQTMHMAAKPYIEPYRQPEESRHDLPWADLITLDLSQFEYPGGKQKLANQLKDAVHNVGFFYITGFGLSQEAIDRQFAIGRDVLNMPTEEKLKYRADLEGGSYNGYRPLGSVEVYPGLPDNNEASISSPMYNMFKFIPYGEREHPQIVQQHREEIEQFQRKIAEDVVQKLLVLMSILLELPEDYLSNGHRYNDTSDCHLRYMIYRARTPEENAKYKDIYIGGHSDFGSLTLLFRQPIAALQIKTSSGEWKWVKPYPESITVNIADILQFWTNGYLKSSIHRVVAPPPDQAGQDRLGLLYFLRPAHNLNLKTVDSPLLRRLGLKTDEPTDADDLKAGDWVQKRVAQNLEGSSKDGQGDKVVLNGLKAKYGHD
ncbi:hypothetical protein LTR37_000353 [Vermiconidia calcicola]|uniref:Uncharacterized protein n=1 Tax=Vermiconidia calcicola TaxID=1690605 RepID=A0ACC3NYN6_9PEZI|nr:hypothetical protein LTR37_000353 [Vermiconidia calcicola]